MFIDNKYTKIYYQIIDRAKAEKRNKRGQVYYERHHIVPKCMGGVETVCLTAREHFICHWLLIKMVEKQYVFKMQKALARFATANSLQERSYTSKQYEVIRRHASEAARSNFIPDNRGRVKTDAMRKAASLQRMGKKRPSEEKLKISQSMLGVKKSDSHREAMRLAWIKRREKKAC